MFPFKFGDKKYYGCLEADRYYYQEDPNQFIEDYLDTWCATELDEDGIFQGSLSDWEDPWGYCDPDCPEHEETLTWRKDETAKVSLQYSNSALWVGLELYGSILLWTFIPGLMLTTFLPILGNIVMRSSHSFP